ncbi:MAG: hypothetical protein WCT08_06300 [Patescibacteria group bacterium]
METKELSQQLLKGSERINVMKQEIHNIIAMTFGFLGESDLSKYKYLQLIMEFTSGRFRWEITKRKYNSIELLFRLDSQAPGQGHSNYWDNIENFPPSWVLILHDGLPDFLANMLKVFPQLEKRFQPLLLAATIK